MLLPDPVLNYHELREDKKIDRGDASIKNVIYNIHLVHPLFVNSWIPKELHHHTKLSELGNLAEENEADVKSQGPVIDLQFAAFCKGLFHVADGSNEKHSGPKRKNILYP